VLGIVFAQASFASRNVGRGKFISFYARSDDDVRWKRRLNIEFLSIAVPAFFQQGAVPLADLVDANFLSRLEPGALGGVGIARASHVRQAEHMVVELAKDSIRCVVNSQQSANFTIHHFQSLPSR
jgi:hypothetical protein